MHRVEFFFKAVRVGPQPALGVFFFGLVFFLVVKVVVERVSPKFHFVRPNRSRRHHVDPRRSKETRLLLLHVVAVVVVVGDVVVGQIRLAPIPADAVDAQERAIVRSARARTMAAPNPVFIFHRLEVGPRGVKGTRPTFSTRGDARKCLQHDAGPNDDPSAEDAPSADSSALLHDHVVAQQGAVDGRVFGDGAPGAQMRSDHGRAVC
mmetsp:Transcript_30080/g.101411  ORF Transcript_30080/g.101411 Transcript_30080/m.101411 type:complete len:207 (-) Transcript_30080:1173-1793(-)